MKRALVLAIAGCGSTSTSPSAPADPQANGVDVPALARKGKAPCTIRDERVELAVPIGLASGGKRFATVGEVVALEVRAGVRSTATLATADFTITGDIDLRAQPIRPREVVQGGWLAIRSAAPGALTRDELALDFKLPRTVTPTLAPLVELPCAALTFARPPELPTDGAFVWMKPASKFPLYDDPGGVVVATIETPALAPATSAMSAALQRHVEEAALAARELARSGSLVRIRTGDPNYVEGWVDAAMVVPPQGSIVTLGTLAPATPPPPVTIVRCPHAVAIRVRDGVVGRYPPDAAIRRRDVRGDEVVVDLGAAEQPAFVRTTELGGCTAEP